MRGSAPASPNNLPAQLTSFVGRERELAALERLLSRTRLLTLTGAGGCGKTRLALELATRALPRHRGGVWFVDLAPLADERRVPHTIAKAVGVFEAPDRPLEDALVARLGAQDLLLLLDNCEHLVDASARAVEQLLRSCPRLRVLATSREALNVPGELSWRVPPLALPDARRATSLEALRRADAVRLFLERGRLSRPGLALTAANAPLVVRLCERLDGLPLALELAAVRLRAMTLAELARRVEDRFRLLTVGARTAVPRQRTLAAAIDWSYEQMGEDDRALFRRVSVFAGGFDLDAAVAICAGDGLAAGEVPDLLTRLVERSMLGLDERGRYRSLETLRQYGRERLEERGEAADARRRHAAYFAALAQRLEAWGGGAQDTAIARLAREHDNLRGALTWHLERDPEGLLRLACALGWFWFLHGHISEWEEWLGVALERSSERSSLRARALHWHALAARLRAQYGPARSRAQQAIALAREIGDAGGAAHAVQRLGSIALLEGKDEEAKALFEESQAAYRALGDAWGIAALEFYLGWRASFGGEPRVARRHHETALPRLRELGDSFHVAQTLVQLGMVALDEGDTVTAHASAAESLHLSASLGNRYGVPIALDVLGGVAAAQAQPERALRLAGAASAAREAMGQVASRPFVAKVDRWLEPARAALRPAVADAASERGRALSMDEAMEYALSGDERALRQAAARGGLTRREREVAALVAQGRTNRQIAEELVISERTAEAHVEHIRAKLGFHSRSQIAAWLVAETARRAAERQPAVGTAKPI